MATYVLVHGGKENGAQWSKLVPLLEDKGHRVYTPSSSDPGHCTLDDHISEAGRVLEDNDLTDIILVGHSYASFIITGVADRMPERIRRLVYIDTSLPADGESLEDQFSKVGKTFEEFGVPASPPFVVPINYDETKWRKMPKTYIRCTQSEFGFLSKSTYEEVVQDSERDNWDYFEIDSDHKCMVSHPVETSEILLREQ